MTDSPQGVKATERPWTVQPGVYDTNPETATEFPHGPEIIGGNGDIVAYLNMYGEDDAELIVRAVNSHDALMKALEEAKAKLEKVAGWLDRLSEASKDQAKTSERFESLKEACLADARNYAATAKSIRSEIANIAAGAE